MGHADGLSPAAFGESGSHRVTKWLPDADFMLSDRACSVLAGKEKELKDLFRTGLALAALAAVTQANAVGRIVVNNDEWTLRDAGFVAPNDPDVFALNVANWFAGGLGNFRSWTTNSALGGTSLNATLTGAGHTWTHSIGGTFDLPTLMAYDGVFLARYASDLPSATVAPVLTAYVNAGGNVYIAAGTGIGGATGEADYWNAFLNNFGLGLVGGAYNGVVGNIAISSPHPIFAGVDHLYQNNGNDVVDLDGADPKNQVLVSQGGHGLYAVYDPVPEPASLLALSAGVVGLLRRRRTKLGG